MYDPAFGPLDKGDICATCRLSSFDCPGHFGHIELPMPVFHPLYMAKAYNLLRGACAFCHHFLVSEPVIVMYVAKLRLLEYGLVELADGLDELGIRRASTGGASKRKKGDLEDGDSTDESIADFKKRIDLYLDACMTLAKQEGYGRDEYKRSGIGFARRAKCTQEFLKSLVKKKCDRCGANAHRTRKEGHTKIVEYSLMQKQRIANKVAGIVRKDMVALDQELANLAHRKKRRRQPQANGINGGAASGSDSGLSEGSGDEDDEKDAKDVVMEHATEYNGNGNSAGEDDEDDDDAEELDADGRRKADVVGSRERQTERIVSPNECRSRLRLLFHHEREILNLLYAPHGPLSSSADQASPDMFFMDVVAVPPTRFRPASTMGDQVFENPQNSALNVILRQTFTVRDLSETLARLNLPVVEGAEGVDGKPVLDKVRVYTQLLEALIVLQVSVNSMIDSGKNPTVLRGGKPPPPGVKQLLEKKDGLFRKNMMGKRVNYAARSVISPDVNIETNEIGVPPVFARKLTFPEPVTAHNINQLRQAVINGPHIHPGASFIESEDGNLTSLDKTTIEDRTALANQLLAPTSRPRPERPEYGLPQTRTPQINKKVYRHLVDGDIVILNRQPTLHKPSMMCHRVKVLRGEKTIRMHYANCNSYNADFDGDEMNMHFPQSLVAQAEARLIANTDNQYLTPTSGNPLRGLIQDHVVAGVWLTNVDTFFTRQQYYQLIYGALRPEDDYSGGGSVVTVPPAILKPIPLWTGKQVITTVLKNIQPPNAAGIHFQCKAKVPGTAWGVHTEEETVLFHDGELVTGILDKAQIGASPFGLVHSVHELYGPEIAGKLLSILSRLLTKFLQSRAFTCRMDDLLLTAKGNAQRRDMLATVNEKGLDAALSYVGLGTTDDDKARPETAEGLRERLEEILRDDYKLAGLDATVEGETNEVTTKLIKTCLPSGLVKPFPHNHMQTMTVSGAKGSNVNASQISCLLGQQSLEGRRVPTMVSGKTLPSFKAFETAPRAGGFVAGRFLTGIRPQEYYFHCMAGREGLIDTAVKTSRSGYLQRCLIKHLEGLRVHYDNTVRNSDSSILQFNYGEDSLDVTRQKHLHQFEFAARNTATLVERFKPSLLLPHVEDIGRGPSRDADKHPDTTDPVLHRLNPSTNLGSVSQKYAKMVEDYIRSNPQHLLKEKKEDPKRPLPAYIDRANLIKASNFRSLMYVRYMRSLVDPGEAVGLMASQGVGEPSTQMTLNTFHFAGHGAANVTLGIPRLREIVMTASQNIKTPTMNLPILEALSDADVDTFCQKATRLTLSQVLDKVSVREHLSPKTAANEYTRQKLYTIRLDFYPRKEYTEEYKVDAEQILLGITRTFLKLLDQAVHKEIKQNDKELKAEVSDVGKARSKLSLKAAAREDAITDGDDGDSDAEEGAGANGDASKGKDKKAGVGADSDAEDDDDADAEDARRSRRKGNASDSDEDNSDDEDEEAKLEAAFAGSDDEMDEDSEEEEASGAPKVRTQAEIKASMKEALRKFSSRYVAAMRFDIDGGEWCEFDMNFNSKSVKLLLVGIVEKVCRVSVIHEISGISRCFVAKAANQKEAEKRVAMTEGVNLRACWNFGYGVVDLSQIYTNDVGAILRTYGVEAARTAIIKEMSSVFGAYGIGVDYRHLTIIADYMTCEGGYKPFNRTGLTNNSSPMLKASFETTANFVAEAALHGDFDDLGTPSANIVLGRVPMSGTGVFTVCSVQEV